MAKIPVYAGAGPIQGPSTVAPANLPAVTNEAIGQGLQTVSKELSRVEDLQRRANDVKNLTNASVSMSQAQADFAKYQQENPDESKWLEKWQETIGTVQTSIGEMPLTPDARAQLTDRFSSWSTRGTINVQAEAFRQTGRRMEASVQLAKETAVRTRAPELAQAAIGNQVSAGFLTREEGELEYSRVNEAISQAKIEDLKVAKADAISRGNYAEVGDIEDKIFELGGYSEDVYKLASKYAVEGQLAEDILAKGETDPVQAMELLKTYDGIPTKQKEILQRTLQDKLENFQGREIAQIADDVAAQKIKRGSDVQFIWNASPAEQKRIRDAIDSMPPTDDQITGELLDLRSRVTGFDAAAYVSGSKGAAMQAVEINSRISKLPPGQREDIAKLWDKARAGQMSVKDSYVSEGVRIVNEFYKAEEEKFFNKSLMGGKGSLKEGKEQAYADFKLRITKMENDLKQQIPDDATPEKAAEVIKQVTGASATEVRRTPYLTPQSGFAPVPGNGGTVPDLPGASGSLGFPVIDTSLFPPVTP